MTAILERTPGHLSIELAAGAAIAVAFLWIAAIALPTQCLPGQGNAKACSVNEVPAKLEPRQPKLSLGPGAAAAATLPAQPAPTDRAPAKPAAQGLIAATFERLQRATDASGGSSQQPNTKLAAKADQPPAIPEPPPSAPATRLVSTTVIRADGTPEAPQAVPADSAASVAVVEPIVAPIPATRMASLAAAPDPAPAPQRSVQTAPTKSGVRQVGGQGVTVRSGPSRSNARMFALAAGEKVTVTGTQKGWLQIIDARGRPGWAYSSYLAKP